MIGRNFGYLMKEGFRNVYVNRLMSFASIGTLMCCMLLIGSALLFSLNANSVVGYTEKQNDVTVWLADGMDDDRIDEVDRQIGEISNIYEKMFVSKDELLKEQMALTEDLSILLDGLEEDNPLQDSYRVRVQDVSKMQATVLQLESIDGVAMVQAPTDVAAIITSIKRAVSAGGAFIVVILVAVSLVIIANTIKVTVFNRRKEISIMKYVGATDGFIRLPFFIEGFLLGGISAGLAFGALWLGYNYVMDIIASNTSMWIQSVYQNMLPFEKISLRMFTIFAGGGIGIGVFGSMFFVNRYLKV